MATKIFKLTYLPLFFVLVSGIANVSYSQPGVVTENPPGTFTYVQVIDSSSPEPYYTLPTHGGGLGIYSWFDQDYGWQHDFPNWNTADINILSSTMIISAWDVDSEPFHGTAGEYDGLEVDGAPLDPGLLQGENNQTSITSFDTPLSSVIDDGRINVWLDIDMNHTSRTWATRIDYSRLEIIYTIETNTPPEVTELTLSPAPDAGDDDALTATVEVFDNDGDNITLTYRWFVDVGQGFYVDDEFAGRGDHNGSSVPAEATEPGDRWKVEVTPIDEKGAIGEKTSAFIYIREEVFSYYPSQGGYNTLAFEDYWPQLGDYDMNDLVIWYRISTISNFAGLVSEIVFEGELVARGAGYGNGFGLSFSSLNDTDMETAELIVNGRPSAVSPEPGHIGELVFILFEDTRNVMPFNGIYSYYNTENGDQRSTVPFQFTLNLLTPTDLGQLNTQFFNPFIIKDGDRGVEIHLVDHPPTDRVDASLFGTEDDNTDLGENSTYRSTQNLPWALNISSQWSHPFERVDITQAYLELEKWVESNGLQNTTWYLNPHASATWH